MDVNIKEKVIVITGSSRGLGAQMAYRFAKEGAFVVINYHHSKEVAEKLFAKISEFNSNCMCICCDVTDQEQIKHMKREIIKKYGRVDVLINNAGICSDNLCLVMPYEQWRSVLKTNLDSTYLCSKHFGKEMYRIKKGKIINIASFKGQAGSEGQCNYAASKAAVIGFTKTLAKEMGEYNVSVNAICPGYIKTDLNSKSIKKNQAAKQMSVMPIDGCLDDLLNFLIFMISDNLLSVSGRVFNLDSRVK